MSKKPVTAKRRKRARRRFNMFCAVLLLGSAIAMVYSAGKIMPDFEQWKYANRRETLDLGVVDVPTYLKILINYEFDQPKDIKIGLKDRGSAWLDHVNTDVDTENKIITVTADIPNEYRDRELQLSLLPANNPKLKYDISKESSYENIKTDLQFILDRFHRKWIFLNAGYDRLRVGGNIRTVIYFEGDGYKPTIYEYTTDQNIIDLKIELTKLARGLNVDSEKCKSVTVQITADGIDVLNEGRQIVYEKTMEFSDFPEYTPDIPTPTDQTWTEVYLDRINPDWKTQHPDLIEDPAKINPDPEPSPESGSGSNSESDFGTTSNADTNSNNDINAT